MRISKDISGEDFRWPQVKERVRRLQGRIYEARKGEVSSKHVCFELLDKHCYVEKTRALRTFKVLQEPDEAKVSRPVRKTGGS